MQRTDRTGTLKFIGKFVVAAIALISLGLFVRAWERASIGRGPFTARQAALKLRADSALVSDELSNGTRYFLQTNVTSENRAELRLVVNAGSVFETEAQRGLAHAVEHMLFRGTKSYPARAIDEYLQSVGMRSGQDLNAWTSLDQTVYTMTIPTDREGVLDTAIAILAEMAHAATFSPDEAKTESGIVFEEWRSSRGAGARFSEQRNQLLLAGSKYATREPIGDTTVLRRFDVAEMRAFYERWYRPELMAVVVVGDIDPILVRRQVRKYFGKIPKSDKRVERPAVGVPLPRTIRAATLTDDEAMSTRVSLWFSHLRSGYKTIGDFRERMIANLWEDILSERLEDAADTKQSPLLWTSVDTDFPAMPLEMNVVSTNTTEGSVLPALGLVMSEIARFKEHGPTQRELQEHGDAMIKEHWRASGWTISSGTLADSYADQFLYGGIVLTREAQYNFIERILPTISAGDLKSSVQRALADSTALILVTQPTKRVHVAVAPETLIAQVREVSSRATSALPELADSVVLVAHPPPPGKIVSESYLRDIETFDFRLSNGVRVLVKPTQYSNSQIEFRMIGPGGASLATDADFPSAYRADGVIANLGVGPLNGTRLERLLNSSSITFDQNVRDEAVELDGYLEPRYFERFFQVLYLKFTAPREDSAAFRRYRERLISSTANRDADPDAIFDDSSSVLVEPNSARAIRGNAAFLNAVDLSKSIAFWKQRMANASGFTLVLTGAFTMPQVRLLLEQYVATLPSGTPEKPRDAGVPFPTGVINRTIYVGAGPRAKTRIMFSGPIDYTVESSEAIGAVRDVAERVLGDRLRETMGGTYGVNVSFSVSSAAPQTYRFYVEFEAAPDRIGSLANAALTELSRLAASGPTASEFEKTRAAKTRDFDNTSESNIFWTAELSQHARFGWPLNSITTHQQHFKDLTVAKLRDACAKFLNPAQHVRITMLPQRKN